VTRPLSLAIADYDRVQPLVDDPRFDVRFLAPSETFFRMLKHGEFDLSEMSLSSYLIARAQGKPLTAIPVFPYRQCFHLSVYVDGDAGIEAPRDLEGKRFGLTEYQVTAAVWTRGVLQHDFGVDLRKLRWFVERTPELSHGGITGFRPPEGITIEQTPEGRTLGELVEAGELDAVLPDPFTGMSSRLNRTEETDLQRLPRLRRLFVDPRAEAARFYRDAGFLQVNHTVVVQDALLEERPELAMELFDAFESAKRHTYARLDYLRRASLVLAGPYLEEQRELFGDDPYPYGLAANRPALETLIRCSHEQGLIRERPEVDSLFHPSTRAT
jgi:4,5-dihydroxyphthalate decarboxylase